MRSCLLLGLLVGCGIDVGVRPDAAGPPGSPAVMVSSPRANESFYMTESVAVTWIATDDDPSVTCEVTALGASMIPIESSAAAPSGQGMTVMWPLAAVAAGDYRVQVSCRDSAALTGTGLSGTFTVSGPPQQVSFATDLQPLFAAGCNAMQCHDGVMPQAGLSLVAGTAHANLVGVPSEQCPSTLLVKAGAPAESYLVVKLQGGGSCSMGSRMPKGAPAWTATQLQLVRDWIANGAPDN